MVDLLGTDPAAALGPARPVADPGVAASALAGVHAGGDSTLLAGLGVPAVSPDPDPAGLLGQLGRAPAAAVTPDQAARAASLRQQLEATAAALADGALVKGAAAPGLREAAGAPAVPRVPGVPGAPDGPGAPDALDQLIARAQRRGEP